MLERQRIGSHCHEIVDVTGSGDQAEAGEPAATDETINRRFIEAPSFALDACSASFLFEVGSDRFDARYGDMTGATREAVELDRIQAEIDRRSTVIDHECVPLIEGARTFLDDITTGPPGTRGRPLFFQASGAPQADPSRKAFLTRPSSWTYGAEGLLTELRSPTGKEQKTEVQISDGFFSFRSGHLFYVITLSVAGLPKSALDEYALIQFEQISTDPSIYGNDSSYISLSPDKSNKMSFLEFVEHRLNQLEGNTQSPNGITHLVNRFGLLGPGRRRSAISPDDLIRLCIAIDSSELSAVVQQALSEDFTEASRKLEAPENRQEPTKSKSIPLHRSPTRAVLPPELLALAGLTQGVIDFPFQDPAEVFDATRPLVQAGNSTLFAHPRFVVEIGSNWRSFHQAQSSLGTCPYLALTWVVATIDEMLLDEIESEIRILIYGTQTGFRTMPLTDIDQIMESSFGSMSNAQRVHKSNLRRRLDLFRREINRPENVFRYPKEKRAFQKIRESINSEHRYVSAKEKADRIADFIDQTPNLSNYTNRRVNAILLILAVLGVISLPANLKQAWDIFSIWF